MFTENLLSLAAWLELCGRFLRVLYPTLWVLLPLGLLAVPWRRGNRAARFLGVFLLCDLALKLLIFFIGVQYQHRYLYVFAVMAAIVGGAGGAELKKLLRRHWDALSRHLDGATITAMIILIVAAVNIPKTFSIPADRAWLRRIPRLVRQLTPPGRGAILISASPDSRLAYYAGAREVKLLIGDNIPRAVLDPAIVSGDASEANATQRDWVFLESATFPGGSRWTPMTDFPAGATKLAANLSRLGGGEVFLLLTVSDQEARAAFAEMDVDFTLRLVHEFRARGKRYFTLYQNVD